MRNHNEKVRDITRSVLPSTSRRSASHTRKLIHRAERRGVAAALRRGDDPIIIRSHRGDITEMVWERRGADKVAPLVRWALHRARTNPELRDASLDDQVEHFRQLLPDRPSDGTRSATSSGLSIASTRPARPLVPLLPAAYAAGADRARRPPPL